MRAQMAKSISMIRDDALCNMQSPNMRDKPAPLISIMH